MSIDAGNNNLVQAAQATTADSHHMCIVRRGFRGDKFVVQARAKWQTGGNAGLVVRWLSPGDWLAIRVPQSDGLARLIQREADKTAATLMTSGSALSGRLGQTGIEGVAIVVGATVK